MPLPSTKLSFFLVGKEIGRTNKDCDVPEGFKAILLLKEGMFYLSSDVTNNSLSKELK